MKAIRRDDRLADDETNDVELGGAHRAEPLRDRADAILEAPAYGEDRFEIGEELRVLLLDDREEERLFRREVIGDHPDVRLRIACDRAEGRAIDTFEKEPRAGRVNDARFDVAA